MLLNPSDIERMYRIEKIVFYKNGLVIHRKARYPMAKPPPPLKKGVYEMSQKSKLKLTHLVANCEIGFTSMFTLTFGDFFIPLGGKELKRQVNVFMNRFRKRFVGEYLWFLEFTKKERPHIHVLTTVTPNKFDKLWLGMTWADISVTKYAKRLLNDPDLTEDFMKHPFDEWVIYEESQKVARVHAHKNCWEQIRKPNGATRYCLKYALKQEQKLVPIGFHNVGRFWSPSRGVKIYPIAELIVGETQTEAKIKELFADTRIGQYPLIPKYIFEQDAMEYFTGRGFKLTEIFGEKGEHAEETKTETVI